MLPIVVMFLAPIFLGLLGAFVLMMLDVLREGPRPYPQYNRGWQWRPPIANGPKLMEWATKVSETVTKQVLSRRPTSATPTKLAEEVQRGTTFAIHQVPLLGENFNEKHCPNRDAGRLGATAPEVLAIADNVRRNFVEAQRVHDVAARNAQIIRGVGSESKDADRPGKSEQLCPLLTIDGDCSAYCLRPVHCRTTCHLCGTMPTKDAQVLEEVSRQLGEGAELGLAKALESVGLDGNVYELNSALQVALEIPDASARWAKGEDIFADCVRYGYSHAV